MGIEAKADRVLGRGRIFASGGCLELAGDIERGAVALNAALICEAGGGWSVVADGMTRALAGRPAFMERFFGRRRHGSRFNPDLRGWCIFIFRTVVKVRIR